MNVEQQLNLVHSALDIPLIRFNGKIGHKKLMFHFYDFFKPHKNTAQNGHMASLLSIGGYWSTPRDNKHLNQANNNFNWLCKSSKSVVSSNSLSTIQRRQLLPMVSSIVYYCFSKVEIGSLVTTLFYGGWFILIVYVTNCSSINDTSSTRLIYLILPFTVQLKGQLISLTS